ncbi:MAG TPA: GreA/GreB family elongation factor [Alphaproteobacteria bacterium]
MIDSADTNVRMRNDARPAGERAMTSASDLPPLLITCHDHDRLRSLIDRSRDCVDESILRFLADKLDRAIICRPGVIPADVVTMNSRVFFRRHVTHPVEAGTLVYDEAHWAVGAAIPVLSPLGAALLGLRVGSATTYTARDGARWIATVERVAYQPEAEGRFLRAPYRYWPRPSATGDQEKRPDPDDGGDERRVIPLRPRPTPRPNPPDGDDDPGPNRAA